MERVSTYLNFAGNAAEAFECYRAVFGTDYLAPPTRMRDMPQTPGAPPLTEQELDSMMHVALPILAGHVLMGTDVLASQGHELRVGNNATVHLEADTLERAQQLWDGLADGGSEKFEIQVMPWGQHWGVCLDRFSIRWMFSAPAD